MDSKRIFDDEQTTNFNENETLKADVIYVILRKSCYVPRSLRLQWFLQHLNTRIRIASLRDLDDENTETLIVSVIPQDTPKNWNNTNSNEFEYLVVLSSNVVFLGEIYRLVYCLDISPSVSTVDIQHGEVLLDVIIEALQKSIKLLIKPFQILGSSHKFTANIFITVIAHTPFYISPAQQVLVQGWKISEDNVNEFLEAVLRQLKFIEDEVARVSGSVHEQFECERKKSVIENKLQRSSDRIFNETYQEPNISANIAMVSPGSGFLNLLRYGMLALKLLPVSNFSNLIVITDGMIIMPDSDTLDSVLNHMRYNDIACYFLHVGSQFHPHCGFGFVPYAEIMQLISVATNGVYMQFPSQHKSTSGANIYHQNLLTWSVKRKSIILDLSTPQAKDGEWYITNRHFYGNRGPQLIMKKYLENDINVTLYGVLACRIREGFILNDLYTRENELVINLLLPWTNHIYIDYTVSCQWPVVNTPSISTHYVINIRAPYEFLHDISCRMRVPIKSPFRQALLARFWRSLKSFAQSDLLLSHLESFMNNVSSYYLPESLKNGMPLYLLLPGNSQPTISSNDIGYTQFGNIWRPSCLLNNNLWQKWFHADRVGVIFRHDEPLNLFAQNFEARTIKYTGLQCRQATNTLFNFLKTYCSFVLIENHSYIKFLLPNESGTGKHSFMVIRSIVKPPYAVLHIAFLYNIPGQVRFKLLNDFKHSVANLKIPRLPVANDSYNNIFGTDKGNVLTNAYDVHVNCCILLDKPLEKILIRYEQMPKEFGTVVFPDGTQPSVKPCDSLSPGRGLITTLSRYLHHRRWIWKANVAQSIFLPSHALEKVLSALIKTRLQEGFYFGHYSAGICNMVLEVQMKGARIEKEDIVNGMIYDYRNDTDDEEKHQSCVIQYLLFSPKTVNCDSNVDDNTSSAIKVVELVNECWIEPVHGVITDCPPVRNYMTNLQYHQVPDAIWASDAKCISALFTFEYLRLMCEDPSIEAPDSIQHMLGRMNSGEYWPNVAPFEDQRISQIPFAYNLPNLLEQCIGNTLNFNLFSIDILNKCENSLASNRILLDYIYNYLTSVHNKELIVSGQDARRLIRNLGKIRQCREKDHFDRASRMCDSVNSLHSDGAETLPTEYDWNRMTHWAVADDSCQREECPKTSQAAPATSSGAVRADGTKRSSDSSHQSSAFDISSIDRCTDDSTGWLKWKCFVRFINGDRCVVTIVPDSLEVIKRVILGSKDNEKLDSLYQDVESSLLDLTEMSASVTARNDSCSFYTTCSSSSKDLPDDIDEVAERHPAETTFRLRASTWDPVRGGVDSPAGTDDRLRTNSAGARIRPLTRLHATRSFDLDSIDHLSEKVIRVSQYVPLVLPLYVCDCSLNDVINSLIWKNEDEDQETIKDNPVFTDKSSTLEVDNSLKEPCTSIESAVRKYFVLSLFKCLHQGYEIPVSDVAQAFNKCETSIVTVDITEYLKVSCKHLKSLTMMDSKPTSFFTCSSLCNELRFVHRLIKRKFTDILHLDFKPIPSKPEFYYFFPSWTKESKPPSVGMLSPGLIENSSNTIADEHIISSGASGNVLGLGSWESCKASVNSEDNACTSLLSNMDSDSLNEASNESLNDDSNPLFLGMNCKITASDNSIHKCALIVIPTCICDILKSLDQPIDVDIETVQITLELVCLTSSYADIKKKYSKSNRASGSSDELNEANAEDAFFADGRIPKSLGYLPFYQYNALNSCIAKMKWLMKDEIVTFMLDVTPTTAESLRTVCQHIELSSNAATCFIEKVPLSFVFDKESTSMNNFLRDFDFMRLPGYELKKLENMYYLIKNKTEKPKFVSKKEFVDEYSHSMDMGDIPKPVTFPNMNMNNEKNDNSQVFSSNDSIFENEYSHDFRGASLINRKCSSTGTIDADDENSRTMQNTVQWILNREFSDAELPNFWLIMTIIENYVTVYFHCRFLEIKKKEIDEYVLVRENVIRNIKDLCKVVNQKMLLENLHETRICDRLLVPDAHQDEETEMSSTSILQSNHTFIPGCLACPPVWETKFILHPRLKVSPLKGAVSRGIQALCSALSGFSVTNRKNLFVYQDVNKNVFYLRLFETVHGSCSIKHENEESSSGSFSRSSSFTSLSRKQFDDQLPFLLDESKTRNKSMSESGDGNLLKNDDFITLKVYGIVDAGKDIKNDLVQVLQNRLDDAVLDVISVMLSRNPLCKLLSEDVHFIQKPNQLPSGILQFSVDDSVIDHLCTFRHFVRQNIRLFATLPKYSDPRLAFHFQDYSVVEDSSKRINESDIFLYNQNPTYSKAIACFAFAVLSSSGETVEGEERGEYCGDIAGPIPSFEELQNATVTREIAVDEAINEGMRIEFRIWKQGKVNMDTLRSKLMSAIRHALWELVMEKQLLPNPILISETGTLSSLHQTTVPQWMNFGLKLNTPSTKEYKVSLPVRSNVHVIFKELNLMLQPHDTVCYAFYKCNSTMGADVYKPCLTFDDKMHHTTDQCLLIARNILIANNISSPESAKIVSFETKPEVRLQRSPSSCQEDNNVTVAKRKFLFVVLEISKIDMVMYNWSKDKMDAIVVSINNFSEWLQVRSSLLTSIVEQKMGLFYNLPIQREDNSLKSIDMNTASLDVLLRYPISLKTSTGVPLSSLTDVLKDIKLAEPVRTKFAEINPFYSNVKQLRDAMKIDRKAQSKNIHTVWQSKGASANNTSVNEDMLNNFLLHGRIIHFCLTPLLFLPRWRFKTAATRDHSLSLQTQSQDEEIVFREGDESWHSLICSNFIQQYKQYLHSMGFHSIQRPTEDIPPSSSVKLPIENEVSNIHYMQKYLLGGVLLFELYFSEPFFNTKLYALEYARLNGKTSPLVSQFTVSFLDECDRIKFQMHLHSFTYDYHLRCLHQFVTDQQASLQYGYHIISFLDDFIKYYPKAPNYARSLVDSEFVCVEDISIPPAQLFDYLLTHRKDYNMNALCMTTEFSSNESGDEQEYVLIKNKSSSGVCYKDVNDQQQTEDFDIIIIISRINTAAIEENAMKFQIYVVITSRRELYPKVELDQKIGKFRTVSTSVDDEDIRFKIGDDSESSKDSSWEAGKEYKRKRTPHHVEIRLESVNYMGYYSSHEEAMQTVMIDELEEARKYIQWMITQGTFDCKTHILWNKLLCSSPVPLNYQELQDLLSMADVYEISNTDDQLQRILNQPVSWLHSFIKNLLSKQPENCHLFSSPNGTTQELLILHPQYINGFIMIVLNLQTSVCSMNLVYRKGQSSSDESQTLLQTLFEQIINNMCFHLWLDAF